MFVCFLARPMEAINKDDDPETKKWKKKIAALKNDNDDVCPPSPSASFWACPFSRLSGKALPRGFLFP